MEMNLEDIKSAGKRILLTAVNAKYIHSNLAVHSLRAYAKKQGHEVEVAEYTINQLKDDVLEHIYRQRPDILIFSCYIWNIEYVAELAETFHKLCPEVPIWAGGPEVSYETETFLTVHPAFTGVMMGEGERTFSAVCAMYEEADGEKCADLLEQIDGIAYRRDCDASIAVRPLKTLLSLDEIPFCYEDMSAFEHRIIYYESSRGCPFRCSYCLSSVDKALRFRSLPLVYRELQFFLDHRVPQVKFVDRTFNCDHEHAQGIWRYIKEHDNGVTNFHFEVSADLLNEAELQLMSDMRPGLIQLEIGVQSTHDRTIREIHRTMRLHEVKSAVENVQRGQNIHQHLDLIAGLPFEDYETFQRSFDDIYAWKPDQLQLGFLKVLKGSYMYEHAKEYGIVYHTRAPYEVLSTNWLSYDELLEIRLVEEMLELHYNSGQFLTSLAVLEQAFDSAFRMFLEMGHYYRAHQLLGISHSRVRRTEIFMDFAMTVDAKKCELYREALIFDLYRIEKSKARPEWAKDKQDVRAAGTQRTSVDAKVFESASSSYHAAARYCKSHGLEKKYCHLEPFSYLELEGGEVRIGELHEKRWMLFDYEKRDRLSNAAEVTWVEVT